MSNAPIEIPVDARAVEPNAIIERITSVVQTFDRLVTVLADARGFTREVDSLLHAPDRKLEALGLRRNEVVHHTARRYGLID